MPTLSVRHALLLAAALTGACTRRSAEAGQTGPDPGASAHRIAAGEGHTCVIRPDTTVWCWGRDSAMQGRDDAKPAPVRALGGALSLSAHDGVTCARTRQGLFCWGDNTFGQLGMPPALELQRFPQPRIVDGGRAIAQAGALGPQAACVLERAGVTCWGEIGSSLLPGTDTRFGPVPVSEQGKNAISGRRTTGPRRVPGIDGAVQLAVGTVHLCALMPDRSVRCMGESSVGQLGRLERGDPHAYFPAAPVPGLKDVVQLEAGLATTCARTARGEVLCWGSDVFSQLGVKDYAKLIPIVRFLSQPGAPHDRFTIQPRRVEGLPPVRQLSVGATHVCAIGDDRRVYCWGMNDTGQLGDGTTERRDVPVVMKGIEGAEDVAASTYGPESHTCVLLVSGKVRCVGRNQGGELGRIGRTGAAVELNAADVEGI